jgi:hypothetical protein
VNLTCIQCVGDRDDVVRHVQEGVRHRRGFTGQRRGEERLERWSPEGVERRREAGIAVVCASHPKSRSGEESGLLLGELHIADLLPQAGDQDDEISVVRSDSLEVDPDVAVSSYRHRTPFPATADTPRAQIARIESGPQARRRTRGPSLPQVPRCGSSVSLAVAAGTEPASGTGDRRTDPEVCSY